MKYSVLQLPSNERPREKLSQKGPEAVSLAELLAIILGSGSREKPVLELAQEILMHFETVQKLASASIEELQRIKGLGFAKAVQIRAAIAFGKKIATYIAPELVDLSSPKEAYSLIKEEMENEQQEKLLALFLNTKGKLLSKRTIAIGALNQVFAEPREVFHWALRHCSASLIVVHNHPSGDTTASKSDLAFTRRLVAGGEMIGIPVIDHLIVGKGTYLSLRQEYPGIFIRD